MFRVHAILNNPAGAVKATKNRGPGYCYRLPEFPSSNFVGHNTGLFFCIYIKFCHPLIVQIRD